MTCEPGFWMTIFAGIGAAVVMFVAVSFVYLVITSRDV